VDSVPHGGDVSLRGRQSARNRGEDDGESKGGFGEHGISLLYDRLEKMTERFSQEMVCHGDKPMTERFGHDDVIAMVGIWTNVQPLVRSLDPVRFRPSP
jgi:hypothetical protein